MERRKTKIIKKKFQYKYALILTLITAFIFILFSVPSILILNNNYNLFLNSGIEIAPEIVDTLNSERRLIIIGFSTLFSICSISLFIIGITITHKIAGPITVLERCIHNLIHGKFNTKMNLRENDELQELAIIFNELKEFMVNKENEELEVLNNIKNRESDWENQLSNLIKIKEERLSSK